MKSRLEITFKSDTSYRKGFFVPESFAHPAKMTAPLLLWIVERYTEPGQTILDPMAGSGTMMLACPLGRDAVMVELEEKFCQMQRDNWEKVRQMPQFGYEMGECEIVQGDARDLEGLFDSVIVSPPYAQNTHHSDDPAELEHLRPGRRGRIAGTAGSSPDNIGNLKYGETDTVISSPPYSGAIQGSGSDAARKRIAEGRYKGLRPDVWLSEGNKAGKTFGDGYSVDPSNIGNLKSDSYLEAMLQVYKECHKVLREGGVMALVTKDFIRDRKRVDLASDTIRLCEEAGFIFLERHYRKLTYVSFWRRIYKQKYPDAPVIDTEDILILRRS